MAVDSTERTVPDEAEGTCAFVCLGCPKNVVDSERMLGLLRRHGYWLVDDPDGADFVIVNTCGFIEQARQESFAAIDEMLTLKRQGRTQGVIVAGCLAERERARLLEQRPQIDGVVGVFSREEIARVAGRLVGQRQGPRTLFQPAPIRSLPDRSRLRITPRHVAYLKISEGCSQQCTFCTIPKIRGRHVSKPMGEILDEAAELARDGTRELILVAQDTTSYGVDLYGQPRLSQLLRHLEHVDGLQWIRLMYFYPMHVTEELIETIAGSEKLLPYIDLPLQHINDTILRRMARRVTRERIERLLAALRARIAGVALRTTLIAGFPGESEEQFEELVCFVEQQRFERLGVFSYSLEPDTPAADLPGHLPEKVKRQRRERLMAAQQPIAFAHSAARIGQRLDCILDRPVSHPRNVWIGRTYADAPDIDPVVYVTGGRQPLSAGAIVPCEIVAAQGYDLIGVAVGEPH